MDFYEIDREIWPDILEVEKMIGKSVALNIVEVMWEVRLLMRKARP